MQGALHARQVTQVTTPLAFIRPSGLMETLEEEVTSSRSQGQSSTDPP